MKSNRTLGAGIACPGQAPPAHGSSGRTGWESFASSFFSLFFLLSCHFPALILPWLPEVVLFLPFFSWFSVCPCPLTTSLSVFQTVTNKSIP